MNLAIRVYGDPCLRRKSESISEIGASERILSKAMLEAMHQGDGVGLAAPQVGINKQIFVADIGEGPVVVVNPRVMKKSGTESVEEGCLSLPGITVKVRRPRTIVVQYRDEDNHPVERTLSGLMARVFLHETDHLFGKLIIDYAHWRQRAKLRKHLEEVIHKGAKSDLCRKSVRAI